MVNPPAKGLSLEIAVKAAEAIADLETERRELNKTLATDARALTQKSARSVPGINLALNSEGKREGGVGGGENPPWRPSENDLSVLAWHLREGRMPKHIILDYLNVLAKSSSNDILPEQVKEILSTVFTGEAVPEKSLAEEIKAWVMSSQGDFLSSQIDKDLNLSSRVDKKNLSKILSRLVLEGLIERVGRKYGCFRRIERDSNVLDWRNADTSTVVDLIWPFHLERLVTLYPKNIVVVAGSPNVGKTSLLLNLIRLNMANHRIAYFSSEMGPEELKLRLNNFQDVGQDEWKFEAYDRSANFADAVQPNAINLIDYLEVTTDFFKVGGEIKAIYDKLDKGVAVIALQKKKGAEYGRGAEFSLEKARLYLSMDDGELKIVKAKNWGPDAKETGHNPNGRIYHFSLVGGCKFVGRYQVGAKKHREREPGEEG